MNWLKGFCVRSDFRECKMSDKELSLLGYI